ncbi:MAG: radical SAM protein [Candidatus Magasanikbacteria bacterium]|nr:radical SAM protein [Candidatus Magasanikbacteria bacterium]
MRIEDNGDNDSSFELDTAGNHMPTTVIPITESCSSQIALVHTLGKAIDFPESLSDEDIQSLLTSDALITSLDAVTEAKQRLVGKQVFVRSSIEISNQCRCACNYCGMSRKNASLDRFRLSKEEIIKQIKIAKRIGVDTIHLTSAEDVHFSIHDICEIVDFVKGQGLDVVLVLGEKKPEEYTELYNAGARKFTMKFETSNPSVFRDIKNGYTLEQRLKCIEILRKIGFQIGTGVIIGLPGQTVDTLVSDLRLLQNLKPEMASASVFIPNKDSEYADMPKGDTDLALRFNILMRLLLRDTVPTIPCSSSFDKEDQIMLLQAAANVISVHLTPEEVALDYSMYGGKERKVRSVDQAAQLVEAAGLSCNLKY